MRLRDESMELKFSKRNFLRDKKALKELFGVNIIHNPKRKGYHIDESEMDSESFERMMEAFETMDAINLARDIGPFLYYEKRRSAGTEHLPLLIDAIKNKLLVTFTYQKYYEDITDYRTAEPYTLKEFEQRWYLLCMDVDKKDIRTFGLDRISDVHVTNTPFNLPKPPDMGSYFNNYFGITTTIDGDDKTPQKIVLLCSPVQGKYIKSLPLHHSQKILTDTEDALQIQVSLCPTIDFIMKLLSFGSDVKVLQPQSLVEEMKERLSDAWKQYESF